MCVSVCVCVCVIRAWMGRWWLHYHSSGEPIVFQFCQVRQTRLEKHRKWGSRFSHQNKSIINAPGNIYIFIYKIQLCSLSWSLNLLCYVLCFLLLDWITHVLEAVGKSGNALCVVLCHCCFRTKRGKLQTRRSAVTSTTVTGRKHTIWAVVWQLMPQYLLISRNVLRLSPLS